MRITGGVNRGRKLMSPRGRSIRPTSEKIRQAVFSILFQRIRDAVFIDLCCGTGIMALEALSRGALHAILVDHSTDSGQIVDCNIEKMQLKDRARFILCDVVAAVRRLTLERDVCHVAYLDPPYRDHKIYSRTIHELDRHAEHARLIVIVEHSSELESCDLQFLELKSRHRYGEKQITLFTSSLVVW